MARDIERDLEQLGKNVEELRGLIGSVARHYGDVASAAVQDGRRQLSWFGDFAGQRAGQLARGTREGVATLHDSMSERPFVSVLVAFLLGMLIGRMASR